MAQIAEIVYGENSGVLRKLVVADSVDGLGAGRHYADGEAIIVLDADYVLANGLPDIVAMQALVDAKRSQPADVATCAVIDNTTAEVTGVVLADPALDRVQGATLFPDANACVGCSFDESGNAVPPAPDAVDVASASDTTA